MDRCACPSNGFASGDMCREMVLSNVSITVWVLAQTKMATASVRPTLCCACGRRDAVWSVTFLRPLKTKFKTPALGGLAAF